MGNTFIEGTVTNMARNDSKRKWDFVNIIQIIADLMQKEGYLIDDDTKNFIPLYAGEEVANKKEAGVIITIE